MNVQEYHFDIGQAALEASRLIVADLLNPAGEYSDGSLPGSGIGLPHPYPLVGIVENLGEDAFTLSVLGTDAISGDNNQPPNDDNLTPVRIRTGAADAVSVTVQPSGKVQFTLEGAAAPTAATGNVDLSNNPLDTETVTVSDGETTVIFEFDNNAAVTAGNVAVTIGVNAAATIANFITAFNLTALKIVATAGAGDSADLTSSLQHIANVAATEAATNCTATGMTGGIITVPSWIRFQTSIVGAIGRLSLTHLGPGRLQAAVIQE